MWRNSKTRYGTASKLLHWLVALMAFGLFGLGLWMVDLDYYHPWYHRGPEWHRGVGMLLMAITLLRLVWMYLADKPLPSSHHRHWEVIFARVVHIVLYILLFALGLSGYFMSTADGRPLEVFSWFAVPSSGEWMENQEDIAGEIHKWLAYTLVATVGLHSIAALKHHLIDRDDTLSRML